jgi:hypothetical protein
MGRWDGAAPPPVGLHVEEAEDAAEVEAKVDLQQLHRLPGGGGGREEG